MKGKIILVFALSLFLAAFAHQPGKDKIKFQACCTSSGYQDTCLLLGNANNFSDAQFLATYYHIGIFDLRGARLARITTQDAGVKAFAGMVINEQKGMKKSLKSLMTKNGLKPFKLTCAWKEQYGYLDAYMGKEFDQKYAQAVLSANKESGKFYESMAVKSKDNELRQMALMAFHNIQIRNDSVQSMIAHINLPPKDTHGW